MSVQTFQITALVVTNNDPNGNSWTIQGNTIASGNNASFSGGSPAGANAKAAAQDPTLWAGASQGALSISLTGGPAIKDVETVQKILFAIAYGIMVIP